ncbi:pentapeptide repeat-containing protein [Actinoallomurus soli]|uniref:pentapeptide repeat-containing protein n=1 Tax=Actinoallomurus soli TaxID=2952535 RepID=UPI002093D897|nr:pentapeptide repeat-containing protein [Actinoallomurus soli]MCO5969270.1 pentapeptide repeat-containing protein [Actinoallomurus soli]
MPNSRGPARLREPAAPRLPRRLTGTAVSARPLADDQVLVSLDLHGSGWAGIQAEDVEVNGCRFTVVFTDCRANLARFRMSTLRDVVFRD